MPTASHTSAADVIPAAMLADLVTRTRRFIAKVGEDEGKRLTGETLDRYKARDTYFTVRAAVDDRVDAVVPMADADALEAAVAALEAEAPDEGGKPATGHGEAALDALEAEAPDEAEKPATGHGKAAGDAPALEPDDGGMSQVLSALVPDEIARQHPDALIEIAYSDGGEQQALSRAKMFNVFDLDGAVRFAGQKNREGKNVYFGVGLRKPGTNPRKRTTKVDVLGSHRAQLDCDTAAQVDAVQAFCKRMGIVPLIATITGTTPERRAQFIFKLGRFCTPDEVEAVNGWLMDQIGVPVDDVSNADRVMRLGGSVSYPSASKAGRGYIVEPTRPVIHADATVLQVDEILNGSAGQGGNGHQRGQGTGPRRERPRKSPLDLSSDRGWTEEDIVEYCREHAIDGSWHNTMVVMTKKLAVMGYSMLNICRFLAEFATGGADDKELVELAESAVSKFGPGGSEAPGVAGTGEGESADDWNNPQAQARSGRIAAIRDRVLTYGQFANQQGGSFLIPGVLPAKSMTVMFGVSNSFKSFLANDAACSVATGTPYHGTAVTPGKVVYIATEGAVGVGRQRIPAWMAHHKVPADLRQNIMLLPGGVLFDSKADDLAAAIEDALGEQPVLLVVDVLAGTMAGSESDDEAAREWVAAAVRLVARLQCALLVVSHSPYSDGDRMRGHSHLWGSFDTRLKVEGDKDRLTAVMTLDRHKDAGSANQQWGFRLVAASPDEHPLETSLVPVLDDAVTAKKRGSPTGGSRAPESLRTLLKAYDVAIGDHGEDGRPMLDGPMIRFVDEVHVRREYFSMRADAEEADTKSRAFRRALASAVDRGLLISRAHDNRVALWRVPTGQ